MGGRRGKVRMGAGVGAKEREHGTYKAVGGKTPLVKSGRSGTPRATKVLKNAGRKGRRDGADGERK